MAYRTIDDTDKFQIRRTHGGDAPEWRTAAELNEYFSKEEANKPISGTPVNAVAATGTAFETNTLTYTAKTKGVAGNDITVMLIDPGEDSVEKVTVTGSAIEVLLAYSAGAITSTLTDVKAAIDADPAASALISVAVGGEGSTLATATDIPTELSGGVDGTIAAAGTIMYDSSALYISVGESTINTANWQTISYD